MDNAPQTAEQINAPQVGWCKHSTAPRVPTTHVQSVMQYDLLRENAELKKQLERANSTNLHIREWWSSRFKRLEDFAREELKGELCNRFFSIVANGHPDTTEQHSYERELVIRDHEIEQLKAQVDQLENNEKECVAILRERTKIVGQSSSEIVNSLVQQLDAANKACAEMRVLLQRVLDSKHSLDCLPFRQRCEFIEQIENALSTTRL